MLLLRLLGLILSRLPCLRLILLDLLNLRLIARLLSGLLLFFLLVYRTDRVTLICVLLSLGSFNSILLSGDNRLQLLFLLLWLIRHFIFAAAHDQQGDDGNQSCEENGDSAHRCQRIR